MATLQPQAAVDPETASAADPPTTPAPAPEVQDHAGPPRCEVWQLLGRADVIVRGCLEARDRAERRLWEERAQAWLQDVGQAWVDSQRRSW